MKLILAILFLLSYFVTAQNALDANNDAAAFGRDCPPEGFDSLKEIDFASYISQRWYSIKQKVVSYQPRDQFYCVYAQYTLLSNFCLFCAGRPRINVFNRALKGSVTGEENKINLRAIIPNPKEHPARAFVAFPVFPLGLIPFTNYWIVAAGTTADILNNVTSTGTTYEWAIITTGKPSKKGNNGLCHSDGGMWIFSRTPTLSSDIVAAIERKAVSMGLDTSQWLPVTQQGCSY